MKSHSVAYILEESNINYYGWSLIADGFHSRTAKKYIGKCVEEAVIFIAADQGRYATNTADWGELGRRVVAKIKQNTFALREVSLQHKTTGQAVFALCSHIQKQNLKEATNTQIARWFKQLWRDYVHLNALGFIPAISDFDHFCLSSALNEVVQNHGATDEQVQSYVGVLSSMCKPTMVWREQLRLLEICKHHKTVKSIIHSTALKRHAKRYTWMNYGYQGPAWSVDDFVNRVQKILAGKRPLSTQLREHAEYFTRIKQEQAMLTKKLQLDATGKRLFKTAQEFMYLKAYRIDVRHYMQYISDMLFTELARRYAVPLYIFRYATRDEILDMIKHADARDMRIVERRKGMVEVFENKKARFIPQKRIDAYLARVLVKEEKLVGSDVKGHTAYSGNVRGIVRIVRGIDDMYKVAEGDILVASATMPDLLPAMARAAAFVTDTGGITSHAAITSREMKKPCIVGTRIATKLFKDGDMVEVDATRGIVKKLK